MYSDGTREKITNPRFRRQAERKVARLQQAVSRKQKGSKNRDKARVKLARAKQQERELRRNHAFQLAKRLVRENQMIAVEDLNVKGLVQGWLAKSVTDTGWGIFLKQLEYLFDINEREFVRVDQFFPSTQLCSQFGERTGKKALHEREFVCQFCGAEVDRDFNAATNIMVAAGRAETLNACGPEIRHVLAMPVRAQRGEAGTIQTRKPSAASVRRKSGVGVHADGRIFRNGTTLFTSA